MQYIDCLKVWTHSLYFRPIISEDYRLSSYVDETNKGHRSEHKKTSTGPKLGSKLELTNEAHWSSNLVLVATYLI